MAFFVQLFDYTILVSFVTIWLTPLFSLCEVGPGRIAPFSHAYPLDVMFSAVELWKTAQNFPGTLLCRCRQSGTWKLTRTQIYSEKKTV